MTNVTRKIVRGGVALLVALGIMTFGINSFQPVHAMSIGGATGGDGGTGGSGGSTTPKPTPTPTPTPTAPAAPYATNVTVTVSGAGSSGDGGGGAICYAQTTSNLQQEVDCVGMSSSDPGSYQSYPSGFKVSVNYNIKFADATPNAIVYCYVYVHGNPTIYSTNYNMSISYTTDGSNVYGFCYAQVGNGPQSAQISLP